MYSSSWSTLPVDGDAGRSDGGGNKTKTKAKGGKSKGGARKGKGTERGGKAKVKRERFTASTSASTPPDPPGYRSPSASSASSRSSSGPRAGGSRKSVAKGKSKSKAKSKAKGKSKAKAKKRKASGRSGGGGGGGGGGGSPGVRGLTNLGNTCFFNSIMQNFTQTTPLRNYFLTGSVTGSGAEEEGAPSGEGALTKALREFILEVWAPSGSAVCRPKPLFNQVVRRASRFRGYRQQDAHELLRYLLDGVRAEEIKRLRPPRRRFRKKKKKVRGVAGVCACVCAWVGGSVSGVSGYMRVGGRVCVRVVSVCELILSMRRGCGG